MRTSFLAFAFAVGLAGSSLMGQSTQPASLPLEYRANQAFNQGRYVMALPLLQELAGTLIDQPDRLGPVEERIRVTKRAIEAAKKQGPSADAMAPATVPAASEIARVPHPSPNGKMLDLPIKELGNFDYDAENGGVIPTDVVNLNGNKLRTYGYMVPMDQAESISEFALVPSLFSCCFGQPPGVQHIIVVHLPKGKAVNYFPDQLQVEGTLHVQERKDAGFIVSIFDMDASSITPAGQ